jgi:hypothetical protein
MAYDFTATISQYLNTASAPLTAPPLTLACWFNSKTTANHGLISLGNSSTTNFFRIRKNSQDRVTARTQSGATIGEALSPTGVIVNNTWNHCCGVFTSSNNRDAYFNGTLGGSNATNVSPSGIDLMRVGADAMPTAGEFTNARIAEVGIWSAALTAAEIASLAKGMTCDKIRPQSLVFYAPLVRDLQDLSGGLTITNNNTATVATHPRVYA